jgi:hypothetical protein
MTPSPGASDPNLSGRAARVAAALFLIVGCLVLGAAVGLMSARLLMPVQPSGWDAIADALGGVSVGALLGALAGAYLLTGLSARARWWSGGVALVLAAGTLWSLALTAD